VDGNVSLRGKSSVTILIDGKPATLLGSDVTSVLQSLPASSIENVEVIANPSAKYDASGTTGIINIVTKRDNRLGVNGNITLGAGTRDKYNGNFGLNIRKGKWSAFMNSNVRINNTYNDVITDRKNIDTSYHTFEHVPRHFNGFFNNIGATYDANKYNSFTVTANINSMDFGYRDYSSYNSYSNPSQTQPPFAQQYRYSFSDGKPFNYTSAIDYKHKFKKKDEELTIDGTFSDFEVKRKNQVTTKEQDSPDTIYQSAPGQGSNRSFTGFADYSNPMLTKNGKFGMGVKTQLTWFDSHNDPTVTQGGNTAVDYTLLVKYKYDQQIHAGYVNWSDQLDKFSYQVGLRAEDAEYNGHSYAKGDVKLHNSFFNFFPSAFVSYQLPKQQSIYLNYSRRTNRPNFFQLLPYYDLSNPGTITTGNPALEPEFIDNIEFSYNKLDKKGNNIILSVYYQYTQNLIDRILTIADTGIYAGKTISMPQNLASGQTYGFEAIGNLKLTKIWEATLSANLFQNDLTLNSQTASDPNYRNRNGFGGFGKINTTIKLPKNFSFQVNGNYESKKVVAQGSVRETYWVDAAIRKSMLKGKLNIVLNCSDIFKSHKFINDYNFGTFSQVTDRIKETRIGNINITYRFGKTDFGKDIAGGKRKTDDLKPTKDPKAKPSDEDRGKNLKDNDDDNQGGGGGQGGGQKGK
jgi:outer membrane receptor protein involved in Fe transport